MYIHLVVEDELSEVISRKILGEYITGADVHVVTIGRKGKGYIKNASMNLTIKTTTCLSLSSQTLIVLHAHLS